MWILTQKVDIAFKKCLISLHLSIVDGLRVHKLQSFQLYFGCIRMRTILYAVKFLTHSENLPYCLLPGKYAHKLQITANFVRLRKNCFFLFPLSFGFGISVLPAHRRNFQYQHNSAKFGKRLGKKILNKNFLRYSWIYVSISITWQAFHFRKLQTLSLKGIYTYLLTLRLTLYINFYSSNFSPNFCARKY